MSKSRRTFKARLFHRGERCCYLCGVALTFETATIDHVIPKARGGTNAMRNLRLACFACNNRKNNDRPPAELATHCTHNTIEWTPRGYECAGCGAPWGRQKAG